MGEHVSHALMIAIAQRTADLVTDAATARAYLIALGTHTEFGDLTPEYGGPTREASEMPHGNGTICSKVKHRTLEQASTTLRKVKNKQLSPYRCEVCGYWHLGNSNLPWKVQARIDQLLKRHAKPSP